MTSLPDILEAVSYFAFCPPLLLLKLSIGPTKPCSPCVFWKENEHNSFLYRPARGALLPLEPPVQFPEAATVPPGAEWSVTGICIS
jgi:hypothetical protein